MDSTSFESRLGVQKSDISTVSSADGGAEEMKFRGAGEGHENVVLVVMDANKELNLTAFNWALVHVVQPGDTVRLLGVLHHIINPMGYKSWADENSWNGASRKVLEHQIATHVAKFKNVPAIYTAVEKLGAKLDIDVRANPHSKNLVVEEARRLGARYVVIDRHVKKDKKFYIDNLTCYVTRVKSMTIFEHLRHGVPVVEDDAEATLTATETSSVQTSSGKSTGTVLTKSQELSVPSNSDALTTAAPAGSSFRPTTSYNNHNNSNHRNIYEIPSPGGLEYGPVSRPPPDVKDAATTELAVRRWLVDSGYRMDPDFHYPASEYGYMTTGYSAEPPMHPIPVPLSPFTEAAMANLYNSNPYASLPPLYSRNDNNSAAAESDYNNNHSSRSRESHGRMISVQTENEDHAIASLLKLQVGDSNNQEASSRAPISVQARRADANWLLDFQFGGLQQITQEAPIETEDEEDEAASSVRRAVPSKKTVPPLCTVCQQKSPVFGKVERFTYAELQDATNNFSNENYLAKGGYGTVYKGRLKSSGQLVAVKQHKLSSSQGDEEFCAEVEVLSCAQHRNLVTLIGYCVERHMRLLVYEYVCNGSLDTHLSSKSKTELHWHQRHKIAVGAASALRYLHEECRVGCIVHRDMRPNNILLTHDYTPMVGDFGLARRQISGELAEETRVLGTIGYLAPEYAEIGQITDKADVYAFGVVLLELLSGRKAIEHARPRHQVSLVDWARPLLVSYDKELVDARLKGQYNESELQCMMHAASQCIKKDPCKRPRMAQVLRILNPPQERDWAYGPGRPVQETLLSSSSSRSSSCSAQSDLSVGSH